MKISKFIIPFIVAVIIILIIAFNLMNNANKSKYNSNSIDNLQNQPKEKVDNIKNSTPIETELFSYTTEILDDSEGRLENIRITCDKINNTIIEPDEIFSFNEIVGQPSSSEGYQEASIIVNGEHETGIGGGNCQVSTTLYNAVLEIENLTIIERNEHGGSGVAYVPKGMDATVSYGSLDFQFRNDNSYKIKILMETDDENITAKIYKIEG